MAAASGSW